LPPHSKRTVQSLNSVLDVRLKSTIQCHLSDLIHFHSDNKIGDEGARHLASALEKNCSITQLSLGCKTQTNNLIFPHLHSDLIHFHSANDIGDEGARHLASALEKSSSITQLNLSGKTQNQQSNITSIIFILISFIFIKRIRLVMKEHNILPQHLRRALQSLNSILNVRLKSTIQYHLCDPILILFVCRTGNNISQKVLGAIDALLESN
jgi:hypothetical protein